MYACRVFEVFPYYPSDIFRICGTISCIISDKSFAFLFFSLDRSLTILFLFEEPVLCFIDFLFLSCFYFIYCFYLSLNFASFVCFLCLFALLLGPWGRCLELLIVFMVSILLSPICFSYYIRNEFFVDSTHT